MSWKRITHDQNPLYGNDTKAHRNFHFRELESVKAELRAHSPYALPELLTDTDKINNEESERFIIQTLSHIEFHHPEILNYDNKRLEQVFAAHHEAHKAAENFFIPARTTIKGKRVSGHSHIDPIAYSSTFNRRLYLSDHTYDLFDQQQQEQRAQQQQQKAIDDLKRKERKKEIIKKHFEKWHLLDEAME